MRIAEGRKRFGPFGWTTRIGHGWRRLSAFWVSRPSIHGRILWVHMPRNNLWIRHCTLPEWAPKTGQIDGHLGSAYIDLGIVEGTVSLSAGVGTLIRDGRWVVFETSTSIPTGSEPVSVVVTNPQTTPLAYAVNVRSSVPDEPETDQQDPSSEQDQGSSQATNTVGGWRSAIKDVRAVRRCCVVAQALVWHVAVFVLVGFRRRPW